MKHTAQQPGRFAPSSFTTNQILHDVLFPFRNAARFPHDLNRAFRCNLPFPIPQVTEAIQRLAVIMGAYLAGEREREGF